MFLLNMGPFMRKNLIEFRSTNDFIMNKNKMKKGKWCSGKRDPDDLHTINF